MGPNVFTPWNPILCWVTMLVQVVLSFATEAAARQSELAKGNYEAFRDFCYETFSQNLTPGVFPLAVQECEPTTRTVHSAIAAESR